MLNKASLLLVGIGAAVITVLGVAGYLLHRKILKRRLLEQETRFAMVELSLENDANDFFYDHDEFYYCNSRDCDERYDEGYDGYPTDFDGEPEREENAI